MRRRIAVPALPPVDRAQGVYGHFPEAVSLRDMSHGGAVYLNKVRVRSFCPGLSPYLSFSID